MNFNQSAFRASEVYQVKDEVAENMQGYQEEMPWGPGNIAKAAKAISKIPGAKMLKDKPSKNLYKVKVNKGIEKTRPSWRPI